MALEAWGEMGRRGIAPSEQTYSQLVALLLKEPSSREQGVALMRRAVAELPRERAVVVARCEGSTNVCWHGARQPPNTFIAPIASWRRGGAGPRMGVAAAGL